MIFNSLNFVVFFILVFLIYYLPLKNNNRFQNILLLLSSYFFYGNADLKILPILFILTVIFYALGISIHKAKSAYRSSIYLLFGVVLGIGILVYYKYLNFIADSFNQLLNAFGTQTEFQLPAILVPLGISFFTFKLISYIIEINRGKIEPTKDFIVFASYISFFPTIMSGPIDRPNTFIPQLLQKRNFDYSLTVDGCKQFLWGLFQKLVIADNLLGVINNIWNVHETAAGSTLFIGSILFTLYIYADFAGYSHMAIGVGKMLGFRVTKNFNYPYFSTNIADFWRNWHISLTSWLTEYVFMPLNIKFRNIGVWGSLIAILITFVLIGLWHGANWTYILFGLYHGLLYIPLMISGSFYKKTKVKVNKLGLPSWIDLFKMSTTFLLVTLGLIFFRAPDVFSAFEYIKGIFSTSIVSIPDSVIDALFPVTIALIMFVVEWFSRKNEFALQMKGSRFKRWAIYITLVILILYYQGVAAEFIYFKF